LHGFVVCRECGQKRCVCVGDDALGITSEDPNRSLIPALQGIGHIHPEKFGLLHPGDPYERYIKFLKRRFQRVGGTFTMGHLFNFPVSPYIDGNAGSRTQPIDFSLEARIFKFCSHVGALLWEIMGSTATADDLNATFVFLDMAYKFLRLPTRGALPGQVLFSGTQDCFTLGFVIPRIHYFNAVELDWLDVLIDNAPTLFFRGPVFMPNLPVYEYWFKGDRRVVNENVYVSALEDLGYVKTTALHEWFMLAEVSSVRVLRKMVRREDDGLVKAMEVQCLETVPFDLSAVLFERSGGAISHTDDI
jgi:hypothetical protein